MVNFGIVSVTLCAIMAFGFFNPIKSWMRSVARFPLVSFILIAIFISLLLSPEPGSRLSLSGLDTNRFVKIILLISISAISCFSLLFRVSYLKKVGSSLLFMILFSLMSMFSFFYSSYPLLSLWKGFEVFAVVSAFLLFTTYLRTDEDIVHFLSIFWLILFCLVLSALIGVVFAPQSALVIQRGWVGGMFAFAFQGVFPAITANSLSQFGAIIGLIGLIDFLYGIWTTNRIFSALIMLIGISALLLAHSRTSLFSFSVGFLFLILSGRKRYVGIAGFLFAFFILYLLPNVYGVISDYILRGQTQDAFSSLSGRTNFWPDVWKAFLISPVYGFGYYAGHRNLVINGIQLLNFSSVDNTYLEVLVDLGVVGLVVFLCSLGTLFLTLIRIKKTLKESRSGIDRNQIWIMLVVVLLTVVVRSLTGPTFQVLHPNLLLFLAVSISASKQLYFRKIAR